MNPVKRAGRKIDTALLAALAALLVVNSHLESLYPASYLAGDGLLGNSLFFFLSGFGLQMSAAQRERGFVSYYRRRIVRLYPALFITVVIGSLLLAGQWRVWRPMDYVTNLVWPTKFTFFYEIVPFYALFFPILKLRLRSGYLLPDAGPGGALPAFLSPGCLAYRSASATGDGAAPGAFP